VKPGQTRGPDGYLLCRITAPHFCAGLRLCRDGNKCAPILRYMVDWPLSQVRDYCRVMEWKLEVIDLRSHELLPALDDCKEFPATGAREGN